MSDARSRGSAVGAGFATLFVGTGVNFSFGILFKPILLEFGWDRSTLALAATASLTVNALGQPLVGLLVDRFGPRRVILPSMALMTLGTALLGVARDPWHVLVLYGVVVAFGYTGSGILPVSIHISRWFPEQRGFVMGVAACGFSLGHLVLTQVAAHASLAVGWRRTYGLLALILLVFVGVLAAWLRDAPVAPAAVRPAGDGGGPAVSLDRRTAMTTRRFWALAGGLMGCGFTDFLLTTHLPAFAMDLGLTASVAANAVSLWAAANIAGILLAGAVAARIGARRTLVLTYLLRATSLFLLLLVRESWQLYLFAILFGATFFTTAPLSSTLVGTLFGPVHHGVIFGAVNLVHHAAGALGSYAGGLVFDLSQSYLPIFLISGVMVVGSAAVTTRARRPDRAVPDGG